MMKEASEAFRVVALWSILSCVCTYVLWYVFKTSVQLLIPRIQFTDPRVATFNDNNRADV